MFVRKGGVIGSLFAALLLTVGSSPSNALELPRLSPKAQVMQQVGVTEITVTYYSPAVRQRQIWGKLVPYNKLWRTGANAATQITFTSDVNVGGKDVKAGTYAIYTIPGEKEWSVMLNTHYQTGGTRGYKEQNNAAVFKIKPVAAPHRERMTFVFSDTTNDTTKLNLEWAKLRIAIPIKVETKDNALANIEKALKHGWRPYFQAARYLLSVGDLDGASDYIETSIQIQPTWWNVWVKAQIHGAKGNQALAVQLAEEATRLGAKDRIYNQFFAARVLKAIAKWKAASKANTTAPTTRKTPTVENTPAPTRAPAPARTPAPAPAPSKAPAAPVAPAAPTKAPVKETQQK